MSRSAKKGIYVDPKLLKKAQAAIRSKDRRQRCQGFDYKAVTSYGPPFHTVRLPQHLVTPSQPCRTACGFLQPPAGNGVHLTPA